MLLDVGQVVKVTQLREGFVVVVEGYNGAYRVFTKKELLEGDRVMVFKTKEGKVYVVELECD